MTAKTGSRPKSGHLGAQPEAGPISRMLAADAVPDAGLDIKLCASEAERAALAQSLGLAAIGVFEADYRVAKQGFARLKVRGTLEARIVQTCVVTLEPFEAVVRAPIEVDFAPLGEPPGPAALGASAEPPDPLVDGQIDLGALAAEFLALNLDLYPRKPGAVFKEPDGEGEARKESPFAVLRRRS